MGCCQHKMNSTEMLGILRINGKMWTQFDLVNITVRERSRFAITKQLIFEQEENTHIRFNLTLNKYFLVICSSKTKANHSTFDPSV